MAKAAYAEARGEPVEGPIAVLNTVVKRTKTWVPKLSPCQHIRKAYQQLEVPKKLQGFYTLLAQGVLSGTVQDVTNGADSFDSRSKKVKGRVTRVLGGHQYYEMKK